MPANNLKTDFPAMNSSPGRETKAAALFFALLTACSYAPSAEAKVVKLIKESNPKINGYALDYCREPGMNCGMEAVKAYCRTKGTQGMAGFKTAKDTPPTRVINGGQICTAPGCDRITEVTCKLVTYPEGSLFSNPQIGGYALDWCREWGANCGEPAAEAFCKSKGFKKLLNYAVAFDRPPTKVISSGAACTASGCDRITSVICQ